MKYFIVKNNFTIIHEEVRLDSLTEDMFVTKRRIIHPIHNNKLINLVYYEDAYYFVCLPINYDYSIYAEGVVLFDKIEDFDTKLLSQDIDSLLIKIALKRSSSYDSLDGDFFIRTNKNQIYKSDEANIVSSIYDEDYFETGIYHVLTNCVLTTSNKSNSVVVPGDIVNGTTVFLSDYHTIPGNAIGPQELFPEEALCITYNNKCVPICDIDIKWIKTDSGTYVI